MTMTLSRSCLAGMCLLLSGLPFAHAADTRLFAGQSGTLDIAGGTAHIPVVEDVARQVGRANPQVRITVTGGGSGIGIQKVGEGLVDIGSTGRAPSEAEIQRYDLKPFRFALDGVAIAVHPSNPVGNLSMEQARDIFSGKIDNWKQVGGPDRRINLYGRDEASATREVFVGKVLGKDVQPATRSTLVASNGAAKTAIARDKGAIGYLGMGYVDPSIKAVSINGVAPTQEHAKSGAYPVVRGLYFNTKGEPKPLAQTFYQYLQAPDGQAIIRKHGYIPFF